MSRSFAFTTTTKRVAPQQPELAIAKSTLEELQRLDVGSWKDPRYAAERMPTLSEVLATVPAGKQIFVEIKCGVEILPSMQPQLESSGLKPEQIVIICFDKAVVTQARKMMPQYNANWLTSYKQETKDSEWKPTLKNVLATLQSTVRPDWGRTEIWKLLIRHLWIRSATRDFSFMSGP